MTRSQWASVKSLLVSQQAPTLGLMPAGKKCLYLLLRRHWTGSSSSAVKRSIGVTIGFHNHGEGPYYGLLLVESAY